MATRRISRTKKATWQKSREGKKKDLCIVANYKNSLDIYWRALFVRRGRTGVRRGVRFLYNALIDSQLENPGNNTTWKLPKGKCAQQRHGGHYMKYIYSTIPGRAPRCDFTSGSPFCRRQRDGMR